MKKLLLAIPFLAVLLLLTACQKSESKPEVVTTFEPMYEFTKAVAGDKVNVENIVPADQEVHEYEPSAREIEKMTNAKAIVYNSSALEKWVSTVKGNGTKIEAAKAADLISGDPHTWVSPKQAILEVQYIADELSKIFPENKSTFEENATKYIEKLKTIDQSFDSLKNAKQKVFITQHEAFSYLARDYGMKQIAIAGLDPEIEPSPSALANLKTEMQKAGLHSVYFEDNSSSKIAETLAKETGAELLVINPVEGLTDQEKKDGKNYLTIMQENLKALQKTIK